MITRKIYIIFSFILFLAISLETNAQKKDERTTRVLFILDASQSMTGIWQKASKIERAKALLKNTLDSIQNNNIEIALRVYGDQSYVPPQICDDTRLLVDFLPAKEAVKKIKTQLDRLQARGTTPIAHAMLRAKYDFDRFKKNSRNIVILITDGKEECDGEPCKISRFYEKEGIILKPFVIGIGPDDFWYQSLDCVGRFIPASSEAEFEEVLNLIRSHFDINKTTTQVYLLDENNEPTETNVDLTFYNDNGEVKYHHIHSMDIQNMPEKLIIDPVETYDIVANTIPPVRINNIELKAGKNNIIKLNTPQGSLKINMLYPIEKYKCIIRHAGENTILNIQEINSTQKYITGKYDIEVLTTPRKIFNNIEIKQSILEESIEIPSTGAVKISLPNKGYGGVYFAKGDQLEKIYNFTQDKELFNLTLIPGKYVAVFRPLNDTEFNYTKSKEFTIKSRTTQNIKLY